MWVNPEAAAAVRRGADFLDNHGDIDWMERIDLEKLTITSSEYCILGQLFENNYYAGKLRLGLDVGQVGMYGFAGTLIDSHLLTDAWRELITEARKPLEPAAPTLALTAADVKLLAKRMKQIQNPDHSLEAVEITIQGVRIVLK